MNIDSIETFILLAKNGNFTKTAEMQYVVQSTISNRINELEKYVGKPLFKRNNRNVELTDAGKAFLPYAKKILILKKDAIIKARSTGIYEDRLSIGVVDSIYKGILSSKIKNYFTHFSNIAVKIKVNDSEEIVNLLGKEIIDVGFIYTNPKLKNFNIIDFFQDDIILVTSGKHNNELKKELSLEEFANLPLLYADLGSEFFKWLSDTLGNSPLLKLSVDRISYVVDFVKDGLGYAFVPKSTVEKELQLGDLVEISLLNHKPPTKKIYMIINKSKMNSPAIKNWLSLI